MELCAAKKSNAIDLEAWAAEIGYDAKKWDVRYRLELCAAKKSNFHRIGGRLGNRKTLIAHLLGELSLF